MFKQKHKHSGYAIAVDYVNVSNIEGNLYYTDYRVGNNTVALYRCECGYKFTKVFPGKWTIEELNS